MTQTMLPATTRAATINMLQPAYTITDADKARQKCIAAAWKAGKQ
jgi:hypothetical protein